MNLFYLVDMIGQRFGSGHWPHCDCAACVRRRERAEIDNMRAYYDTNADALEDMRKLAEGA